MINWKPKSQKERNKEFNTASQEERRVMVCEDVLLSMKLNAHMDIICGNGYYYPGKYLQMKVDPNAEKSLRDGQLACTVCARGAMMLSKFKLKDVLSSSEAAILKNVGGNSDTVDALDEFTKTELKIIESFFEAGVGFMFNDGTVEEEEYLLGLFSETGDREEAHRNFDILLSHYSCEARERLEQIMKKIIECNGDVVKALTCTKPPVYV